MMKDRLFTVLTVWLVLTQTFPPINLLFPFGNSIKFAVFLGLAIVLFPSLITKRSIISLMLYTFLSYIYYLFGNAFFDSINAVVTVPLVMMGGLVMTEYAFQYDYSYKYSTTIIYTVICANVVMAILSLPQIAINPDIIRHTSEGSDYAGVEVSSFLWLIQYQTIHGLPFLFAPLAFMCRKLLRRRSFLCVFWLLTTLLLFYIVFKSNAATPFLISTMLLLVGYFYNAEEFNKSNAYKLIIIGLLGFLFLQPNVISPVVDSVQKVMDPRGASYRRMGEIRDNIVYGDADGDLGQRRELYESSTRLFLESPILGTSKPEYISRHTWIMDRLALFGLFFIIPLVLVFVSIIKVAYRGLVHTKVVYVCSLVGMLMMLLLKNDFGQGTWLYGFAYMPLLCRYIDYLIDKGQEKIDNRL